MVDVFEEVEEQLRSERYKKLALTALPWIIAVSVAALLATVAYWGYAEWRDRGAAEASLRYGAALEAAAGGDFDKAYPMFGEVAGDSPKVYRAMALMQQAAIRLEQGRPAEAVKLYDAAAEQADEPLLGDMARLKSAFAVLDTAPYAELEKRLTPLTEEKRPYRLQAREALAFAKLLAGKTAEARGDFSLLIVSPDASKTMQDRATAARAIIDTGSAASIPAAVKAAVAAPPASLPAQSGAPQ